MELIKQIQQEEKDYLDALKKAYDFRDAVNKLTPQNKERFIRELSNNTLTIETVNSFLRMFKCDIF